MSNRIMTRRGLATVIVSMIGLCGPCANTSGGTGGRPLPSTPSNKSGVKLSKVEAEKAELRAKLAREREAHARDIETANTNIQGWKMKAMARDAEIKELRAPPPPPPPPRIQPPSSSTQKPLGQRIVTSRPSDPFAVTSHVDEIKAIGGDTAGYFRRKKEEAEKARAERERELKKAEADLRLLKMLEENPDTVSLFDAAKRTMEAPRARDLETLPKEAPKEFKKPKMDIRSTMMGPQQPRDLGDVLRKKQKAEETLKRLTPKRSVSPPPQDPRTLSIQDILQKVAKIGAAVRLSSSSSDDESSSSSSDWDDESARSAVRPPSVNDFQVVEPLAWPDEGEAGVPATGVASDENAAFEEAFMAEEDEAGVLATGVASDENAAFEEAFMAEEDDDSELKT